MTGQQRHRPKSAALTLVELLVVITILLIVAGVVLPLAQPALKGRTVREAAREVQTFLVAAQAKAVASQHIVGVQIERVDLAPIPNRRNHGDDVGYRLTEVQMPSPMLAGTTSIIALPTQQRGIRILTGLPTIGSTNWQTTLNGAIITFGADSQWFRVNTDVQPSVDLPQWGPTGGPIYIQSLDDPCSPVSTSFPLFPPPVPAPVRIYLGFAKPRFSTGTSLELPNGTYVDLSWSGTSDLQIDNSLGRPRHGKFWDDGKPVTLVFSPNGSLRLVYGPLDTGNTGPGNPARYRLETPLGATPNVCSPFRPRSDIYLLVSGRKQRNKDVLTNFAPDSGSLWVVVSANNGSISTSSNLGTVVPAQPSQYPEEWLYDIRSSASKAIRAGG